MRGESLVEVENSNCDLQKAILHLWSHHHAVFRAAGSWCVDVCVPWMLEALHGGLTVGRLARSSLCSVLANIK
jgi:hypothetical protein